MTYSNAVPRIGSANPDKKKMGGTFYDKSGKKVKTSERK